MTQLVFPLLIGFLLLGTLAYWFLQAGASRGIDRWETQDILALERLESRFLPAGLVDRIFAFDDFAFTRDQKEPAILRSLEAERKAMALYWLGHTQQRVRELMAFYLRSAQRNPELSAKFEVKLALNYLAFGASCNTLRALIWLRGPFHAREVARRTMAVAGRFCTASEKVLIPAEPAGAKAREAVRRQWPAD